MDSTVSPAKPKPQTDSPFDLQGFKNLLETLKESKRQQNPKTRILPDIEE
jgi:hypothetical protein